MPDHVHLLVRLRPGIAPASFIQKVKANSSKWINDQNVLASDFKWQVGGGIFSIGQKHVPYLIRYIENQKSHHAKKIFRDEYIDLIRENKISFRDEYLLDFHE